MLSNMQHAAGIPSEDDLHNTLGTRTMPLRDRRVAKIAIDQATGPHLHCSVRRLLGGLKQREILRDRPLRQQRKPSKAPSASSNSRRPPPAGTVFPPCYPFCFFFFWLLSCVHFLETSDFPQADEYARDHLYSFFYLPGASRPPCCTQGHRTILSLRTAHSPHTFTPS